MDQNREIESLIGSMPYRLALAGGWIDQPFLSRLNPEPPGSMVVVQIEPDFRFMDRCGMATSTRKVAMRLWHDSVPQGDPEILMRMLFEEENRGRSEPSGSQDMAGLLFPGINRLDYSADFEGGVFPIAIESIRDDETAHWLERHLHILPVNQRPDGYSPLGIKNFDPEWISRLGRSGKDCFTAIRQHNLTLLGKSMNDCMRCWKVLLPDTIKHASIPHDLEKILCYYQERSAGAMYSGCGGGYLLIATEETVPGSFQARIRTK